MEENKILNDEFNKINSEIKAETEKALNSQKQTKTKPVPVTKVLPDELYYNEGILADKKYSIFSTLNVLNRNSDLFHPTKNTVSSALKTIFTTNELASVIEETNCTSLEKLSKQVEKALYGKNNDVKINAVASQVNNFLMKVQSQEKVSGEDKEYDVASGNKIIDKLSSGPHNLINQTTKVYGTNRYFDIETKNLELTPLFVKLYDEKNAVAKINEVEQHVKNVYGYNVTYSQAKNPVHLVKKTLKLNQYESEMDSCVNMLYSTAQTLVGSKKVGIKLAKQTLGKNNDSEFLNSKNYDNKNVKKTFNEQKNTIKDVVSTLSTIFMARFVFDAPEFAEIERDLSEQACKKMQTLVIGKNPNEDYWINQFIQDRLKVNISQILTANNITNANQLLKIFNKNGTMVINSKEITNLEDLAFAVQYSGDIYVDNKQLENLLENNLKVKAKVKNKEVKVKKPKPNKYLDNVIRQSENYKKYYEQYLKQYKDLNELNFAIENEETQAKLKQINSDLDKNLSKLAELSEKSKDNKELQDSCTNLTAKTDALKSVINEKVEENKESSDEREVIAQPVAEERVAEVVVPVEEIAEQKQYSSQNRLGNFSDEQVKSKVEKHYQKMVFGSKGKPGIVSKMLNYRLIEKSTKKSTTYESDNERLDDKDLNKANKIRDAKANETIEAVSNLTYSYYLNNKENLSDETVSKLCSKAIKNELEIGEEKAFNHCDVKKVLAIEIAETANKELKQNNIELYAGKKTYKEYGKYYKNETKNEEKELSK